MVHDEVQDDFDVPLLRFRYQAVEIGKRAVLGIDVAVIGNVIPKIDLRRGKARRDPDRVNTEPRKMVEVLRDAVQVAGSIVVGIAVAAGIDLVHNRVLPPVVLSGEFIRRHSRAGIARCLRRLGGPRGTA